MSDIIPFPSSGRGRPGESAKAKAQPHPPKTVYGDRGWRILEFPGAGKFLAVSDYCRRGVEVGRFDPQADRDNQHDGRIASPENVPASSSVASPPMFPLPH